MVIGTDPIPILEVEIKVVILEVPETFTLVVKMFEVVRALVKKALPTTYRSAPNASATVPMPMVEEAARVERFEVPVMFNIGAKRGVEILMAVTFVVARFEVPVTFRAVAKRLVAFMIAALPLV